MNLEPASFSSSRPSGLRAVDALATGIRHLPGQLPTVGVLILLSGLVLGLLGWAGARDEQAGGLFFLFIAVSFGLSFLQLAWLLLNGFAIERGEVPQALVHLPEALRLLLPVAVVNLVWIGASGVGLLFLIVPGVFVYLGWMLAPLLLVRDRLAPGVALQASWARMQGRRWTVFGFLLRFGLLWMVAVVPLVALLSFVAALIFGDSGPLATLVWAVVEAAFSVVGMVLSVSAGIYLLQQLDPAGERDKAPTMADPAAAPRETGLQPRPGSRSGPA